jgi:hypothetical protein
MRRSGQVAVPLVAILLWTNTAAAQNIFRTRVEAFGNGAELKVELHTGLRLQGSIASFDESAFELLRKGKPRRIGYMEVRNLEVIRIVYRDPTARSERVQSAVNQFTNRRLKVKVISGDTLNGRVVQVRNDTFLFKRDARTENDAIPYSNVTELRPSNEEGGRGSSGLKKFLIGYGIIMGLILMGSRKPGQLP